MEMTPKTCEICNKICEPFPTQTNTIHASEWYCRACHKSYPMNEKVARSILTYEAQQRR